MARQRDYRAEYLRRQARAAGSGMTPRQAAGHRPLRAVQTAAGRVARTGSRTQVEAELKAAARRGDLVALQVKGQDNRTGKWTTRTLDQLPGFDPGQGGGSGYGGTLAGVGGGDRPVIDVMSGAHPGKRAAGFDPQDLLDLLADLDLEDWWDFLMDWWDDLYG